MENLVNKVWSSTPPSRRENLLCVLSAIVVLQYPPIATLSDLLELTLSDISLSLHYLGTIVEVEELPALPQTITEFPSRAGVLLSPIVSLQNLFMGEFFKDKSSAGKFWVDCEATHKRLQQRADYLLSKSISLSPIEMHRLTRKTIFHYLTGLWTENQDDFIRSWKDSWPLFVEELEKFQLADPAHQRVVTSNPQSVRTFRLLLRCCAERNKDKYPSEDSVNFGTAQSVVAAALQEWFEEQSPDSKGMFDILPYLYNSETSMWTETIEEISEQLHLSWDVVFRIIDQSRVFIDVDSGNVDDFQDPILHAYRVCVDWSLMDVIENPSVVGPKFFTAYREARIRALWDAYEDFLDQEHPAGLQRKAQRLFRTPMRSPSILTIDPDIDDPAASSLAILVDRIHSPQSLSVLLSPDLSCIGCHTLFGPLMCFLTHNYQKASTLGSSFEVLHRKLKDLLTIFIQHGALTAAFEHPNYHDVWEQRQNITLYRTISNLEGFDQGQWLDLIDSTAHITIIDFFLGEYLVECFHGRNPRRASVEWSRHFTAASDSPFIVGRLRSLRLKLQDGDSSVISQYKPLLSTGSFAEGLKIWKEKNVEQNSEAALVLDELCAQLSSIDWHSVGQYESQSDSSDTSDEDDTEGESEQDNDDADSESEE